MTTYLCKFVAGFRQIFAPFSALMAKICISLFFRISASKSRLLLIMNNASDSKKSNQIQREFDSNVAIATFETVLASSHPPQKTNLRKLFCSASPFLCSSALSSLSFSVRSHRRLMLSAEMLNCYHQTESKGNFCLITVYSHKTLSQPQNFRAEKQTFSNDSFPPVGTAYSH
jgi:hypothetical protein